MDEITEQLLEAWRTNNRINLFLIDAISDEAMKCTLSTRGGRNVVRQFAHLHMVRYWHLEKRAKDLIEGLHKFATKDEPDREFLKDTLSDSEARVETLLVDTALGKPKRRGFKRGPIQMLSYFIAHESHHRGSILLTLKQSGHKVEQAASYAIWDWDRF